MVGGELRQVLLRRLVLRSRRRVPLVVEAEHRQHAVSRLAIRDLKGQALGALPSGKFNANAAWTVLAYPAHKLLRWTIIRLPATTIRLRAQFAGGCPRSRVA